jgi:uncharacterized Zn finger protein (UPF0148 family)
MSLFENVGRKVEKFKQQAQNAADDPTHGCKDCKTALYSNYKTCPKCGSDQVLALSNDEAKTDNEAETDDGSRAVDEAEADDSATVDESEDDDSATAAESETGEAETAAESETGEAETAAESETDEQ